MNYIIIYQKKNGDIIYRTRKYLQDLKIGDITSAGWTILDIQFFINNRFHSYENFQKILDDEMNKIYQLNIKKQKKEKIIEFFTKNRKIGGKK